MFQGKMLETHLKMNDTHPTKFSGTRKSTNTPDSPGGVFDSCACLPNYVLGWFPEARRKMVSKWLRSHDHILYRGNNCNYIFDSYIMYIYIIYRCILCHVLQKGIGRVRVHANTSERIMAHCQNNTGSCLCISFCWGCCLGCCLGPNASMISLHQHASVSIIFSLAATHQR